jgi:hypothetical protein
MIKKPVLFLLFLILILFPVIAQNRSFNEIFPNLSPEIRAAAFSASGYFNSSNRSRGFAVAGTMGGSALDTQIVNAVMGKNPGYLVESMRVIRGPGNAPGSVTLLDVYNALGDIRGLKGRLYQSETRKQSVPLFEDATRLISDKKNTVIPDPPPARSVPPSETLYIRLKDANFGNSFYRGEMSLIQNGLLYRMSNYKNLTYLFIPVIREDKFTAQLYFEIINEGVLIYGLAGVDVSDFAASKVDMASAISKRLEVIISWVADGIEKSR